MSEETEISVKVLTPKGSSLDQKANFVKVPGVTGEIGVLPNHTASLCLLKTGEFQINQGETKDFYFISKGTAHITENSVSILTPYLEKVSEIVKHRAEKALKRAETRLSGKESIDQTRAEQALKRAQIRLEMYQRHHIKK